MLLVCYSYGEIVIPHALMYLTTLPFKSEYDNRNALFIVMFRLVPESEWNVTKLYHLIISMVVKYIANHSPFTIWLAEFWHSAYPSKKARTTTGYMHMYVWNSIYECSVTLFPGDEGKVERELIRQKRKSIHYLNYNFTFILYLWISSVFITFALK